MNYVKAGDKIADPFGGVGLGAFYSAMNGIAWTCCELEPLFWVSGHRNFEKWIDKFWCACGWEDYLSTLRDWLTSKDDPKPVEDTPQVSMFDLIEPPQLDSAALWAKLLELVQLQRVEAINRRSVEGQFCAGCGKVIAPYPVLLQGDSRFLSSILGQVEAVVSSPPYIDQPTQTGKVDESKWTDGRQRSIGASQNNSDGYGQSPGQLGSMPAGEYDSIISSPAYGSGEKGHPSLGSVNQDNWGSEGTNIAGRRGKDGNYGNSDAQLANLPDTGFDMAISSPPFADNPQGWDKLAGNKDGQVRANPRHDGEKLYFTDYAKQDSDGNLGNLPTGEYDAVISSSPFANSLGSDNPDRRGGLLASDPKRRNDANLTGTYGDDEANLGTMAEGEYDAIIGSPPFVGSGMDENTNKGVRVGLNRQVMRTNRDPGIKPDEKARTISYGQTDGQLGSLPDKDYDLVIGSPPFADNLANRPKNDNDTLASFGRKSDGSHRGGSVVTGDYGNDPNQLGNLPPGDFDLTISSPSWAGNSGGQGDASRNAIDPGLFDRHQGGMKRGTGDGEPGNIDHMAEGDYSAVIGPPPFEDSLSTKDKGDEYQRRRHLARGRNPDSPGAGAGFGDYGQTPNQLGNQSGVTFWAASKDILLETHKVLRKGGYTFWVVKRYIKAGKIVEFDNMRLRLCQVCGFQHVETIYAWQTEDKGTQVNLEGEAEKKIVRRQSFFRLLYTKKYPENAIDYEVVLVLRKL